MMSENYRIVPVIRYVVVRDETFEEYVKRNPMPTQPVTWEKCNKR